MGALPDTYTAYRPVGDEDVAQSFEAAWGVNLSREKGFTIPQMFDAAIDGRLKAMYIFGEDVAQTDPDTKHVVHALESLEFLVCQEIFENETTKYADVILPSSAFLEKSGTFTNAERRFQLVSPAIDPPGLGQDRPRDPQAGLSAARPRDPARDSGRHAWTRSPRSRPSMPACRYERLGRKGLQWPVAPDGTDSPILYTDRFHRPGGRGAFAALPYKAPGDEASEEFPLILVTGRRLEHYNSGTMTRRTGNLTLLPSDVLEINPVDAAKLGLDDGDIVTVRSRHGQIALPVELTERIVEGHVFTAFHFPEVRTNLLVGQSSDVNTSCPEYKVIAVDVQPATIADETAARDQRDLIAGD